MMILAVATTNKGKIREIKEMLAFLDSVDVRIAGELAEIGEIPETGETFEENALIKAREVCRLTGQASLADDSGLSVDALDGEPGVYSARFGGGDTDGARNKLLLERMKSIPDENRTGRFVCVMALVLPDGREYIERGECEGIILRDFQGDKGFGYDPLFFITEKGCSMAELETAEKNRISHRGKALEKMIVRIKNAAGELS